MHRPNSTMQTNKRQTTGNRDDDSKLNSAAKVETFELSKKDHPYIPVSTTKILGKFTRDPPPDLDSVALRDRQASQQKHAKTIEDLRRWAKNRDNSTVVKVLLRCIFWKDVKVKRPPEKALHRTIGHYFPPRSDLKVTVCDFGQSRSERREVRLGDIEKGELGFALYSTC